VTDKTPDNLLYPRMAKMAEGYGINHVLVSCGMLLKHAVLHVPPPHVRGAIEFIHQVANDVKSEYERKYQISLDEDSE